MALKPVADIVVLKPIEAEETTKAGIILTSASKEKSQIAEVVAVGPGTKDVEMYVKAGDKVITAKYSGTEVKYDGVDYIIVRNSDILTIVE